MKTSHGKLTVSRSKIFLSSFFILLSSFIIVSCDDIPSPDPIDPLFGTNRFDSREHETALGSMVCDAMVWSANLGDDDDVDFGVINGGIFEYGLPKKAITAGMIPGMLKGDTLMIIELSGAQVIELFEWLAALRLGDNAWAQVSEEVSYTIDWTNGMGTLRGLQIKGMEVVEDAVYRLCTGDVLIYGKPNSHIDRFYPVLNENKDGALSTGKSVSDAVQDFVASRTQPYIPEIDGRILIEK
jgi:5'-nucleotidase/UDP-sugar diphosphatase